MKKSRLIVVLMLAVMMVLTLSLGACSNKATDTPAAAPPAAGSETNEDAPGGEPADGAKASPKIGYIITFASHEWYANQVKGSEDTAKEFGYEFIVVDAENDQEKQISQGENLLAQDIDILIMAPVDGTGALPLIEKAQAQGVVVVTTSVISPKQDMYVGISDYEGAYALGLQAGQYVVDNKLDAPKVLQVGLPALPSCVDRTEGFKAGLLEKVPGATFVEVDGGGNKDTSVPVATDALTANPDITMIMGINDDSNLGGVQAYKSLGYDMDKLTSWGMGLEGIAAKGALLDPTSSVKGECAMFPEYFGRLAVLAAVDKYNGKDMPEWICPPTVIVTPENLNEYYVKEGDAWQIQWPTMDKLGYDERSIA